jgi:hypothetical protein
VTLAASPSSPLGLGVWISLRRKEMAYSRFSSTVLEMSSNMTFGLLVQI